MIELIRFLEEKNLVEAWWKSLEKTSPDFGYKSAREGYLEEAFTEFINPANHNPFEYFFKEIDSDNFGEEFKQWETVSEEYFSTARRLERLGVGETLYLTSSRTIDRRDDCFFYDYDGLYVTVTKTIEDMTSYLEQNRSIPYASADYVFSEEDNDEDSFTTWELHNGFSPLGWFKVTELAE